MQQDDLLAAALDNSTGVDVDVGRAALAFDDYSAVASGPSPHQAYDNHTAQDFHDYLSDDSDVSFTSDLSPDEVEQLSLAQRLSGKPLEPVHGFPLPTEESTPLPPNVQDQPDLLHQLELARQRLSARPPAHSFGSGTTQDLSAGAISEGTITSTIRTSQPYRRTIHLTESTDGNDREAPRDSSGAFQANQTSPAGYSISFLLLISFIIAIVASLCTAAAVVTGVPLRTCRYSADFSRLLKTFWHFVRRGSGVAPLGM